MNIKYIEPENVSFERTGGGFLSLRLGTGECYPRVNIHKAFPFTNPGSFLSVRDPEGKEIGIIRAVDEYPAEMICMIEEDLGRRYFSPLIQSITSVKEEFGYSYWDVVSDAGPCRFTVRGGHGSVVHVTDCRLIVIDVDGNRFEIPDINQLDVKSLKKIELFL